jgi:hypothetical protein
MPRWPYDGPGIHDRFVPLSVRHGGPRRKLGWWVGEQRERVALVLAPWLAGRRRH